MALTLLLAFVVAVLVVVGLYQFWVDLGDKATLARAANPDLAIEQAVARRSRLDRAITRSRWGQRVQDAISLLGFSISPSQLVLGTALFCLALGVALGLSLSWLLRPVGMYGGWLIVRGRIRKQREKR